MATGHVRKEGNTWFYYIDLGRDENGKRLVKKKRGFKTKRDAVKAMNEILTEIEKGTYVEPSEMLYKDYLINEWLEDKKINIKKSTFSYYEYLTQKYIIPLLGKHKLKSLSALHIQQAIRKLHNDGKLNDEGIQKVYTLINNSLNKAVKLGLIGRNVAALVDRPKATKKEIEVWDVDEVKRFLEVAKEDRLYIAFHLALTTGMRQSEILGLLWENVDLEHGVIYVKQQLDRNGEFTEVKTHSAYRNISLDDETISVLEEHKKNQSEERELLGDLYSDMGLVVCTSIGTPMNHRNLNRTFYRLIEKAGVKKIRFHDLRHTHASLLLKQGVNPKIVAERLGHANTKITLDTYSHVLPNMQKEMAKQFGQMLFG